MESVDKILDLEKIIDIINSSPLELGIKAALIAFVVLCLWWIRRKVKEALVEGAQRDREASYVKDEQTIGEKNEKDNQELAKDQENLDNWAEEQRKKDKGQ
jgi:flagellar biosynthesis/type III secretory pathway M-ring protein FliF/YscJ